MSPLARDVFVQMLVIPSSPSTTFSHHKYTPNSSSTDVLQSTYLMSYIQ